MARLAGLFFSEIHGFGAFGGDEPRVGECGSGVGYLARWGAGRYWTPVEQDVGVVFSHQCGFVPIKSDVEGTPAVFADQRQAARR